MQKGMFKCVANKSSMPHVVQIFKTLNIFTKCIVFDEFGPWTSSIALTDECI